MTKKQTKRKDDTDSNNDGEMKIKTKIIEVMLMLAIILRRIPVIPMRVSVTTIAARMISPISCCCCAASVCAWSLASRSPLAA